MLRCAVFLLFFLYGCGKTPSEPLSLPQTLGSGWTLTETTEIAPAEVGGEPGRYEVEFAVRARYSGTGELLIMCYRMKSEGTAFELVQKWRPADGAMAIYRGPWFATLEGESLSHDELSAAAAELEQAFSTY